MGISELNSCYKGLFTYYVSQILAFLDPPRRQQPSSFATPLSFGNFGLVWSNCSNCCFYSKATSGMDWTGLDWMDGSDVILLRRRVLLEHLAVLIRSTRLPDDCDIGNPASIQNTCAQISCLEDIVKKSGACDGGSEKKDCLSLEKVSAALSTVSKQYSCDGEFISPLELSIVMPLPKKSLQD